jgi:hypothetical protein
VAVTSVEETLFTFVAGIDPKLTSVTPERNAPLMVTVSPPVRGEESGVSEVIVGVAGSVVRKTIPGKLSPAARQKLGERHVTA